MNDVAKISRVYKGVCVCDEIFDNIVKIMLANDVSKMPVLVLPEDPRIELA